MPCSGGLARHTLCCRVLCCGGLARHVLCCSGLARHAPRRHVPCFGGLAPRAVSCVSCLAAVAWHATRCAVVACCAAMCCATVAWHATCCAAVAWHATCCAVAAWHAACCVAWHADPVPPVLCCSGRGGHLSCGVIPCARRGCPVPHARAPRCALCLCPPPVRLDSPLVP